MSLNIKLQYYLKLLRRTSKLNDHALTAKICRKKFHMDCGDISHKFPTYYKIDFPNSSLLFLNR